MHLLGILIEQLFGTVATVLLSPWLVVRAITRRPEMRERLGWVPRRPARGEGGHDPAASGRPLWIHAASLGELEAVRTLAEDGRYRLAGPVHLTVLSVSGRPRAERDFTPAGWSVSFAPLDLWFALWPFLARLRPRGVILVETELWPAMLLACRLARVPVAVVSGRLSERRWSSTRRLADLYRPLLRHLAACAVQTEVDADRFRALGACDPVVAGNLKYRLDPARPAGANAGEADSTAVEARSTVGRTDPASVVARSTAGDARSTAGEPDSTAGEPGPAAGRSGVGAGASAAAVERRSGSEDSPLLFVAGSLRLGEEGVLAAARLPGVQCVFAPRHLRERDHWVAAMRHAGIEVLLRREAELPVASRAHLRAGTPPRRTAVAETLRARLTAALERTGATPAALLLDTHGELAAWYAACDAAFVGGTLAPIGGHNLFEPAREGIPLAFGPDTRGVRDVAEPLLAGGGGVRIEDGAALVAWLQSLRDDAGIRRRQGAAAFATARALAGAAGRTWPLLARLSWAGVSPGSGAAAARSLEDGA